ncbi:MAG: alpha/beta hydrolase [Firmicutes bacterium HGW-Firmicutes-16]|nr:MAG: alpha/beta hydrolase [Firmicutes bacterium HGW-Firmicutes-16]
MLKQEFSIMGIPSVLWGGKSDKLFLAVHGNMSNKADVVIAMLAEEVTARGYQVLSFDLPEHGDRKSESFVCSVSNCVHDLHIIIRYAQNLCNDISIFACSMGAYFSLLTYRDFSFRQCLFLSPILNMQRIIENMMAAFGVSKDSLEAEKEISTPIGQTLSWDYYSYVKSHPIEKWDNPTAILYGSEDDMSELDVVAGFSEKFNSSLTIMERGEHYFHTEEQLLFFSKWLHEQISTD